MTDLLSIENLSKAHGRGGRAVGANDDLSLSVGAGRVVTGPLRTGTAAVAGSPPAGRHEL